MNAKIESRDYDLTEQLQQCPICKQHWPANPVVGEGAVNCPHWPRKATHSPRVVVSIPAHAIAVVNQITHTVESLTLEPHDQTDYHTLETVDGGEIDDPDDQGGDTAMALWDADWSILNGLPANIGWTG